MSQSDLAIEWIETLAANVYPKAKNKMKNSKGYCCLGVARETCGLGGEDTVILEKKEAKKIGLFNRGGCPKDKSKGMGSLTSWNDHGKSHAEIAVHLVKNADSYFIKPVAEDIKEHFSEKKNESLWKEKFCS